MGLGKTIQVLALLLAHKNNADQDKRPNLLIAPASLLANWAAEIERSAPSVRDCASRRCRRSGCLRPKLSVDS
jgi:non-specific serine/threonine protein kinase